MSTSYKIIENTSTATLSVADLRRHLQLFDDDSYDDELGQLLLTAAEYVGDHIGEAVTDRTIEASFSSGADIVLPHKNITDLVVKYYDLSNVVQTLDTSDYILDKTGDYPVVTIKQYPFVSSDFKRPIFCQYIAGMSVVAPTIRHALLMTAAELFEVRTETTDAKSRAAAICVSRLLSRSRVVVV